jgi:hypothetical protein
VASEIVAVRSEEVRARPAETECEQRHKEGDVSNTIDVGAVLIREGTLLPKALRIECKPCVPGWALVEDFDAYELDRQIQKTGWTFFCLAGDVKATVFGIDRQLMVRRAIERILGKARLENVNSLEITQVASVGSERFPVVRYVTVSAHSRHIQESLFPHHVEDRLELESDTEPGR